MRRTPRGLLRSWAICRTSARNASSCCRMSSCCSDGMRVCSYEPRSRSGVHTARDPERNIADSIPSIKTAVRGSRPARTLDVADLPEKVLLRELGLAHQTRDVGAELLLG